MEREIQQAHSGYQATNLLTVTDNVYASYSISKTIHIRDIFIKTCIYTNLQFITMSGLAYCSVANTIITLLQFIQTKLVHM